MRTTPALRLRFQKPTTKCQIKFELLRINPRSTDSTDAVILDHWGIVKTDIGIRDGRISGIGKAGNPDTQAGVDIMIGPGTKAIAAEGCIVTAGAIVSTSISSVRNSTTSPLPSHGVPDLAAGEKVLRKDGPGITRSACEAHARRATFCLCHSQNRQRRRSSRRFRHHPGPAGRSNAEMLFTRDETLGAIKWADANALSQLYGSRRTARRPQ